MMRCFVIQPFDGGPFDSRYEQVVQPAITDACLEPYRVDRDPTADVIIEHIEREIREAAACVADVTTDNPNVWYELGYAMAVGKPVCMICHRDRKDPFPFDIRHRKIIEYNTQSPDDFTKLRSAIAERLQVMVTTGQRMARLRTVEPSSAVDDLRPHEVACLVAIFSGGLDGPQGSTTFEIQRQAAKAGYNSLATGVALKSLARRGFVKQDVATDQNDHEFFFYTVDEAGEEWILANQDRLNLAGTRVGYEEPIITDDDIPF